MRKRMIAVIGSGENVPDGVLKSAEETGKRIAGAGFALICGGRGGVMEAACRGAKLAGGQTVGILPGLSPEDANPYVDIAIPTGLGFALRNFITIRSSEAVIMFHGEVGTLAEVILSYQHGKPVVAVESTGGWASRLRAAAYEEGSYLDGRKLMQIHYVSTPQEAVDTAVSLIGTVPTPAKI